MSSPETVSAPDAVTTAPRVKRRRTRSGCLNCRRKKRKCDETRPACARCSRVGAVCEWGVRVSFRPMNQILSPPSSDFYSASSQSQQIGFTGVSGSGATVDQRRRASPQQLSALSPSIGESPEAHLLEGNIFNGFMQAWEPIAVPSEVMQRRRRGNLAADGSSPADTNSPQSLQTERAAAHLLSLSQTESLPVSSHETPHTIALDPGLTNIEAIDADLVDYTLDDGLFLPGSAYLDLHSTLRSHLIQESNSCTPTRCGTPKHAEDVPLEGSTTRLSHGQTFVAERSHLVDDDPSLVLTGEQESLLWVNWLEEVAPWLDKFDHHKHFQYTLSPMSQSHAHVKYAIMAVSARQMERKGSGGQSIPSSLALYQQAIHLLLPHLATRSTPVIASCVVLCVLEMLSCSPKAWRRHLDGCATLLQAVGIHGFSGGLEQALFWCFARMDVCGGLISSTKTLIPVSSWTPEQGLRAATRLFEPMSSFDMHANLAVYLTAHVVDLLATAGPNSDSGPFSGASQSWNNEGFLRKWEELWDCVDRWYISRTTEMHPVFTAQNSGCFPTILFTNPAAISGNQMYHTAALLMLQHKPKQIVLAAKPRSIFWHARRIVGISKSNAHHGCWTNSLQPIWIAGRLFSSPAEHREILALLAQIEKESGWATEWRADDLRDWWGEDLVEEA
ncbi:hypothetical protein BX600DRAFT_110649 [Xylariales sp. PMI_506]|nr:hypothetical protein BX600DRAFT_110649 [Xylariales sp. PMI_506]